MITQHKNVFSDELCSEIYEFAINQVTHKDRSQPREITDTWTNASWSKEIYAESPAIICMKLPERINNKIINNLKSLDFLELKENVVFAISANVGTCGSFLGKHSDGENRKAISLYLNKDWGIEDGGIFIWYADASEEWKAIVPEYNLAIYNTENGAPHFTTPVLTKNKFRISLQVFILEPK